ncbi:MAG: hypothetical protein NZ533_05420, partial [Casimicrobiaceae bacterium]|nr:hypothetical protein [Casimicrobiaceae bacterium]
AKVSKEYVLAASDILDILDRKNTDFERGCKALAFVLAKCVPIFGETYSEAVKTIPYIVTALTTFTAQWNRELVEWGLEPIYLQNPFSKK